MVFAGILALMFGYAALYIGIKGNPKVHPEVAKYVTQPWLLLISVFQTGSPNVSGQVPNMGSPNG